MLKLRKVELFGFKSFCEKTQIRFSGSGITCIVGPNGCGKSNIADAISWVLGEQSHKMLRAERMSDCIFNGTAKRPPLGLAEVSLTLVDPELAEAAAKVLARSEEGNETTAQEQLAGASEPKEAANEPQELSAPDGAEREAKPWTKRMPEKPALHARPGEVVIGRRLYRSGASEYLINGRLARLRDIQELFMGMGLGPDSYAIIEQGRIGLILNSRPMDRRAIVEEAAGITVYKTKKRLAEAKLEASKLNLARVNDILVEVEKQLASLKRQASKARRYAELREQMRALLRTILASKAQQLDAGADRLQELLGELTMNEEREVRVLRELEAEQQRLSARSYELDAHLRQTQNLLGQSALELDRTENRAAFNREQIKQAELRLEQLAAEVGEAEACIAELESRAVSHRDSVSSLREQAARLEAALREALDRAASDSAEQSALEVRIEELRREAARLVEEAARAEAETAQAEETLAGIHAEEAQHIENLRNAEDARSAQSERLAAAEAKRGQAEQRARELGQAVRQSQVRLSELRRTQQEALAQSESARDALASARARRQSLEQILNERAYTAEAVQKLFDANGRGDTRGFRPVGLLADYAEVREEYEGAIEQFLREELEYVVVETFDHARAGIALLREEMGGCATFFVDSLRNLKPLRQEPPASLENTKGILARLDNLVEFRDPLGPGAKQFLPKLQSAYLVETAVVAECMAHENPQCHFLTPDGVCYHGRIVSGGRPGEAGPLALKRELRRLDAEVRQLEREAAEMQERVTQLDRETQGCEESLAATLTQHIEAEKSMVAATHIEEQERSEMARREQNLVACREAVTRLRATAAEAAGRAAQARKRREEAIGLRARHENDAAQAAERLRGARQEMQARQAQLVAQREEMAAVTERLANAASLEERLGEETRQARQWLDSLLQQREALARERLELQTGTQEHGHQAENLRREKARLEAQKEDLEREWEATRGQVVHIEDDLRGKRQSLDELRALRGQREVEKARNDAECAHLRETCVSEVNAQPEELMAVESQFLAGEELTAAEARYAESKARVEAMGPVNMMALEEYQECEQRCDFLNRERDDLVQSIENTQQAIRELDEVSRQRFEEALTAINVNFADAFRTLFGGGTGEMRLTEPDSSGESGIDIVAQPPGKRLQNVLLLSGGEKALAALALLIAIFRYRPSPFCILDEVDAPLDEANVGRFNTMLAQKVEQTQFIIVTHNRRTMEMGSVLYGVTMEEPGVSKIVSVRWEEEREARSSAA